MGIFTQAYQQQTGQTPPQQSGGVFQQTQQSKIGTLPKPQMPILTNPNGGFGTALKDVAVGAGKDLIGTARDTAGLIQNLGKGALGAIGFNTQGTGIKSIDNSTPEGAGVSNMLESKSRGEQVGKVLSTVTQIAAPFSGGNAEKLIAKGKSMYEGLQASREAKATTDATAKVSETISQKPTIKQAKIAQTEGRLIEGKKPTLLKAGTEDKILPSTKTMSASNTIVKEIPGASKMSSGELYKAVDENINKTAKALRPQMEATPIKPETIQKINEDWTSLKKTQLADAPATEEANVAKRQDKFESLLQKSGNTNHADLWDTRINYDNSIPDNVKQATSISPESLQLQKEEWLQNRDVLNKAIHDTESGMSTESRDAFKKMSDMYEAKNGLLSKAKVNGAEPSKISQFLKDHPNVYRVIKGTAIYEALKGLGVRLPSL